MEVFRGLKVLGGRSGSIQRSEGEGWEEWKYTLVGRKKVVDGPSGHYNSMCIITVNKTLKHLTDSEDCAGHARTYHTRTYHTRTYHTFSS